jgi:hypothetical protein
LINILFIVVVLMSFAGSDGTGLVEAWLDRVLPEVSDRMAAGFQVPLIRP